MQINTFQGFIISDGVQTYYVFTYACGAIQWSGLDETAIIGYNSNAQYYSNHPANGIPDIGQIISCTRQPLMPGTRSKRQTMGNGGASGPVEANVLRQLCGSISMTDSTSVPDINDLRDAGGNDISSSLPPCPKTRDQIQLSSHIFDAFPLQEGNCYRSNSDNTFVPVDSTIQRVYIFVSVCCYTDNG